MQNAKGAERNAEGAEGQRDAEIGRGNGKRALTSRAAQARGRVGPTATADQRGSKAGALFAHATRRRLFLAAFAT